MYGATFPQYLSKPYQVLWLELDDLLIVSVSLIVFLIVIGGIAGWALTFLVPYSYGRVKKRHARGFFKHVGYFLGISNFEGYPTYFQQKFME